MATVAMHVVVGAPQLNAMIIPDSEEHRRLREDLEKQELDAPGGVPNGQVYLKLLAVYLLQNDLCNAKYLWKRMPQSVRMALPELALVWNVGQKLWQRDFPGIYAALNQEWSESVAQIMQALTETTRARAIHLISRAYSSIGIVDFAGFVGLAPDQAAQLAVQHGWQVDRTSEMIHPNKLVLPSVSCTPSEEQLMKLTDFVTFLEN